MKNLKLRSHPLSFSKQELMLRNKMPFYYLGFNTSFQFRQNISYLDRILFSFSRKFWRQPNHHSKKMIHLQKCYFKFAFLSTHSQEYFIFIIVFAVSRFLWREFIISFLTREPFWEFSSSVNRLSRTMRLCIFF